MHEILGNLGRDAFVLDLGSKDGSFPAKATAATIVRIDRDLPVRREAASYFVQCDASQLPFANATFQAIISNHSLEHIESLAAALGEIGRVVNPGGCLFVAVPDASTITDKLYRWLAQGGGHVNAFTVPEELAEQIGAATKLRYAATKVLCSSLSFLNPRNGRGRAPRRLMLFGGGSEWSLFLYGWLSRRLDRWFGLRSSIYGWAFYLGTIAEPIDTTTWGNVCLRCGSGVAAADLTGNKAVRRTGIGICVYNCPQCGALNPFAPDV